jgi:hypothetical protein
MSPDPKNEYILPMLIIFPCFLLSIDLAASFERRKTALSWVSKNTKACAPRDEQQAKQKASACSNGLEMFATRPLFLATVGSRFAQDVI